MPCAALQVHTLLKGLEKIAASADIPMLVRCGHGFGCGGVSLGCRV